MARFILDVYSKNREMDEKQIDEICTSINEKLKNGDTCSRDISGIVRIVCIDKTTHNQFWDTRDSYILNRLSDKQIDNYNNYLYLESKQ
jgi:predicted oxidoreductase (fatty acid repression mutant protein)